MDATETRENVSKFTSPTIIAYYQMHNEKSHILWTRSLWND